MEAFAREKLLPLANVFRGVPIEVAKLKEHLEMINGQIAAAEQDKTREGIRAWVEQLRETAFLIEEVLDDCMISEEKHLGDPICAALSCELAEYIKTLIFRLRISYKIQDIEPRVREIYESQIFNFQIQSSFEEGSSSSTVGQNVTRDSLRANPRSLEEAEAVGFGAVGFDVVGFEEPIFELIDLLLKGRAERTVISVLGMGGVGKTTLARKVYDKVNGKFDCQAWIRVDPVYTVEDMLRDMLNQFCGGKMEAPPKGISEIGGYSLIEEVRKYLREKRYVIFFDDVWNINFWSRVEFALLDNKKKSRILITTRNVEVAEYCMESSLVHLYRLQPLSKPASYQLFCKYACFQDGECPEELKAISSMIVERCNGLPLAILTIGRLLRGKNLIEWRSLYNSLTSEVEKNLNSVTNTLAFSYDNLPYYLKPCILYFGIYPEDYEVESTTLIKQWIAEGFVEYKQGRTLEEVAEQYLEDLISNCLVQVSSFSIEGKAKRCRVHVLIHDMILTKIKDLSFCHFVKHDESVFVGMIRRLKVATNSNNLMVTMEGAHIQSLYIFREKELPEGFVRRIPANYKLLKVLDFEHSPLRHVPEKLGNLFHLRYLSFRKTDVESLPSSIGSLHFLETLDLRQTRVRQMPREINKLTKLRHLLANHTNWGSDYGIQMMEGIGGLVSLQTLRQVETDYRGEELIEELEKLKQLRLLGLIHVKREYGSALCSSINVMQHLKKLYIDAIHFDEVIDLNHISPLPILQKLHLGGKLERLPRWIPKLQNLVKLSLISSKLTDDPLESLKDMPCLLSLSLDCAYEGQSLHIQDGGFQKLKKLALRHLHILESIIFGERGLPSLEEFKLEDIPQLKEVPSGIHHLGKLRVFHIINMPEEFRGNIREHARRKEDWINYYQLQVNITD